MNERLSAEKVAVLTGRPVSKIRAAINAGIISADRSGPGRSWAIDPATIPDAWLPKIEDDSEVDMRGEPLYTPPFNPPPPEPPTGRMDEPIRRGYP